jgi:hypothetical protein
MIRNVLSHSEGISLYGVVAIVLFFTTFAGVLVWALSRKPALMKELGALPLSDAEVVRKNATGEPRDESIQ